MIINPEDCHYSEKRLESTQKMMIDCINKQLSGIKNEYILSGFNEEQLKIVGSFVVSFYRD